MVVRLGTGENQRLIQFCLLSNHNDQNSLNFQPNLCPKNRHMLPHFVLGLEQQNVRDAKPGVLWGRIINRRANHVIWNYKEALSFHFARTFASSRGLKSVKWFLLFYLSPFQLVNGLNKSLRHFLAKLWTRFSKIGGFLLKRSPSPSRKWGQFQGCTFSDSVPILIYERTNLLHTKKDLCDTRPRQPCLLSVFDWERHTWIGHSIQVCHIHGILSPRSNIFFGDLLMLFLDCRESRTAVYRTHGDGSLVKT